MNQRWLVIVGIILLVSGCFTALYLGIRVEGAYIRGIFNASNRIDFGQFAAYQCPIFLTMSEVGKVAVSIANPTAETLKYSVAVSATGFRLDPPTSRFAITIKGKQTTNLSWKVTAQSAGNQAIMVDAISDRDAALPGPYHDWPTSFSHSCGIFVIAAPFTGTLIVCLIALIILIGAALTFAGLMRRPRSQTTA